MFKKSVILIIFSILVFIILTCYFLFPKFANTGNDYNLIIMSVDSLRADHLGCYNYFRDTSPNIDKFASNAILFEHATTQGEWTVPSYASLFTSTYPSTHKVTESTDRVSDNQKLLAEVLKEHGYKTIAFTEDAGLDTIFGFDRGFDVYNFRHSQFNYADLRKNWSEIEIADIRKFLKENKDEKFFIFIQLEATHDPYLPNPPYDALFDQNYNGSMPTIEDFYNILYEIRENEGIGLHYTALQSLFWLLANDQPDSYLKDYIDEETYFQHLSKNKTKVTEHDHIIALYDGQIREIDDFFEKMLKELDRGEIMNKTIIILTADHGEEFYEHGYYDHFAGGYEKILHVPLIIKYPNMPEEGSRVRVDAELIDVMPTIFNILNLYLDLNIKEQMEGRSLIHILENGEIDLERDIFSETNIRGSFKKSIRSGEWKLIHDFKTGESELYNLEEDPEEQNNVIGNYPEITEELKKRLFSFIMRE